MRMPDSFFQYDKKRKRPSSNSSIARPRRPPAPRSVKKKPKSKARDEDLSSESGGEPIDLDRIEFRAGREEGPIGDDEYVDENETAAEKRVRLAKGYLARVRDEVEAGQSLVAKGPSSEKRG